MLTKDEDELRKRNITEYRKRADKCREAIANETDRDKIRELLCTYREVLNELRRFIDNEPTEKPAPVVYCQNCLHATITATIEREPETAEPAGYMCRYWNRPTRPEGFCDRSEPYEVEDETAD